MLLLFIELLALDSGHQRLNPTLRLLLILSIRSIQLRFLEIEHIERLGHPGHHRPYSVRIELLEVLVRYLLLLTCHLRHLIVAQLPPPLK